VTKILKISLMLACTVGALSACDQIRTVLHMMPNQDAQQCLNSERLNFKDPDVLFVANLGSRGLPEKEGQYWVRYKAKNSYGAYLQGNMLCEKSSTTGEWKKASMGQYLLELELTVKLLEAENKKARADSSYVSRYTRENVDPANEAAQILLTSPDDLKPYFE